MKEPEVEVLRNKEGQKINSLAWRYLHCPALLVSDLREERGDAPRAVDLELLHRGIQRLDERSKPAHFGEAAELVQLLERDSHVVVTRTNAEVGTSPTVLSLK